MRFNLTSFVIARTVSKRTRQNGPYIVELTFKHK